MSGCWAGRRLSNRCAPLLLTGCPTRRPCGVMRRRNIGSKTTPLVEANEVRMKIWPVHGDRRSESSAKVEGNETVITRVTTEPENFPEQKFRGRRQNQIPGGKGKK